MTIQQAQQTISDLNAGRIPPNPPLYGAAIKTLAEVRRGVNFGVPSTVSQNENINVGSAPGTYGPLGYEASAGMFPWKGVQQPNVPNTTATNYVPGVSAPAFSSAGVPATGS